MSLALRKRLAARMREASAPRMKTTAWRSGDRTDFKRNRRRPRRPATLTSARLRSFVRFESWSAQWRFGSGTTSRSGAGGGDRAGIAASFSRIRIEEK